MSKNLRITDEIMSDFFDVNNTKSLNEILYQRYEGEINDLKQSNEKLKSFSPVKLAVLSAGITGNSQMKDFTAQGAGSSWLLPAYIDETLHEDVTNSSIMPYLVTNTTAVNSLVVQAATLDLIDDKANKDAVRMKRVSEGADLPLAELKLGETAISLFKYGRAVQATYESMAYMKVDMFSKTINYIASDVADMQSERAINVLVNGDGNKNAINTIQTASQDVITQDEMLDFMIAFQKQAKVPITTIITGEKFFKQLWKMKYSTQENFGIGSNFTLRTPQFSMQNVDLVLADVPQIGSKDAIVAFNKDMTLVKYTAPSMNIREIDKNIRNQTQLGTISEISGFSKFNKRTALALVSK